MTQEPEQQDFERAAELADAEITGIPYPHTVEELRNHNCVGTALARICMRERLAVDLTPWAEHRLNCEVWDAKDDCTCGLSDALAGRVAHG